MKRFDKMSGAKILPLTLCLMINYPAPGQSASNIPSREHAGIGSYSGIFVEVEGKLALCSQGDKGSVFLNVTGGVPPYTFQWNTKETTQNRTNLNAGTYTVLITDSEGVEFTERVVIQPPFPLILNPVENKDATCGSGNDGYARISVKLGRNDYEKDSPPYKVTWSNGLENVWEAQGLAPGTYTVVVTDKYNCDASISFDIKAASESIQVTESIQTPDCGTSDSGKIGLDVIGGVEPYSYTWSNGARSKDLTNLTAGTYQVSITDSKGCSFQASYSLSSPETPLIQAKIETALDVDCPSGKAVGVAWVSIQGGKAPYAIQWANYSSNSREINFNSAGVLKATVTDALGCSVTAEAKVDFPNQNTQGARLDFNYRKLAITSEPEVMIQEEILFESDIAPEIIAWEWEFGDGNKSTEKDPIHVFSKSGEFEVKLTGYDLFGCSIEESNQVLVKSPSNLIVIPNAFSPNGDKLNDTFRPKLKGVSSFQLEVYNTWGEILFKTNSLESDGWDGTYKGQPVPAGSFLYRITYGTLDGQSVKRTGGITLIR